MIDLINIRSIDINLADESAWIQAGATLSELYYKISETNKVHGFPSGLCPSVGIGSQISGGGFGTLFRKHGLAADHLVDAYGHLQDERLGDKSKKRKASVVEAREGIQ
ncbi:FAD-binding berberine family protein [Medicago truncatula]|uniref:FAD-binding berberine family protein n=1 Tax=Medicago truncatula TaxID=3880 RepID=A0A072VL93_MEDTR|nr:FAD-binding berberine family protein [Medicago truncatula]